MDIGKDLKKVIRRINKGREKSIAPVFLSISPRLSAPRLIDYNPAELIEKFLHNVVAVSHPSGAIRVSAHRVKNMMDLEKFFAVSPSCWLHLSVESESETGFGNTAKEVLKDLGFSCSEWIGVEDSESQLGAFSFRTSNKLSLALFIQDRGARRHCDFLIPVIKLEPSYATANNLGMQAASHSC